MKVQLWKLSDIKPYPGNPRHNDDAVAGDNDRARQDAAKLTLVDFIATQRSRADGEKTREVHAEGRLSQVEYQQSGNARKDALEILPHDQRQISQPML